MTSSFSHMVSVLRVLFRVPPRSKVFSPVPVCVAPCKLKRFSESDASSSDRKLRKGSHDSVMAELKKKIEAEIRDSHVLVYSKTTCPFCKRVKNLFGKSGIDAAYVEVDVIDNGADIQAVLAELTGQRSVPNVFVNGRHVGGCDKTIEEFSNGSLARKIIEGQMQRDAFDPQHKYDYDLVVIGGGSGGLACAKEAAKQGARVACLDFVQPTPQGTSWGLGGTCVNVGCIPKKLMHQAALLSHSLEDSRAFGWETPEKVGHSWGTLVTNIQDHIGSLNWGYRVQLRDKNVKYINASGEFTDAHTLKHVNKRGKEDVITSARFVVAVGGRPRYPDIPGAKEYGITSDDLFSLGYPPGKTLCIGASYVSLECAGFLAAFGFDTTVMVRSILLRGFDQQMAELVGKYMENHSIKFKRGFVPTKIELIEEGTPRKLRVHFKEVATGEEKSEEFNTVLFAIGRDPTTKTIGLEKAGVQYDKNGFIPAIFEQTNVPHIYALGDVLKSKLELTPLAIHAGKLLSQRLFGGKSLNTEYMYVPTTVFTPLEYGCCGLPEEDAKMIYGEQNIEVYHAYFQPLEWTVPHREDNACYGKLVVNKADNERVLAFHLVGPNAGEITQGYAVAIRTRATKSDFDATIGIHPTTTENFTTMDRTKSSGEDPMVTGC